MDLNDIFYCGIGGSISYNLKLKTKGDTDLIFIHSSDTSEIKTYHSNKYDIKSNSTKLFYDQLYSEPSWLSFHTLFLSEYLVGNDFIDFILQVRNIIPLKNLQHVYKCYNPMICNTKEYFSGICSVGRKHLMYTFLFLNLLSDLPKGKSFQECFKPTGELHNFLINVRKGEYEEEYLWERFLQLEKEKDKEAKFYDAPRDEEFFKMLKNEIDKYNFLPYEEWKKMYDK